MGTLLNQKNVALGFIFASIFSTVLSAEELGPFAPYTPFAPTDIRKGSAPLGALSKTDTSEISGEFGGILYMAQRTYSYEGWPGREMADCRRASASENWCGQCELIMGHASASYYFYSDSGKRCTLKQVDARFEVSDPAILKNLRRTVQSLFGLSGVRAEKSASKETGWTGTGKGWAWRTQDDLAFLYMDKEQASFNGEGMARFQWKRVPLSDRAPFNISQVSD